MKSSSYSSVNGCTWFVAVMHIPGGQAVTLPDFFLIRTRSLHMQTRRHSRDRCAPPEQFSLPQHPCPQCVWINDGRAGDGEGSTQAAKDRWRLQSLSCFQCQTAPSCSLPSFGEMSSILSQEIAIFRLPKECSLKRPDSSVYLPSLIALIAPTSILAAVSRYLAGPT